MNRHHFLSLTTIYLISAVLGISGCDLPSPPPDMFYKFDVMPVGKGPSYLLTIDLNLDGDPDLVTVNTKDSSLSLLYGKGDGTFQDRKSVV